VVYEHLGTQIADGWIGSLGAALRDLQAARKDLAQQFRECDLDVSCLLCSCGLLGVGGRSFLSQLACNVGRAASAC